MVLENLQGFNFNDIINLLLSTGVYDVVLPFLLVFAIIFAILEKTAILGGQKRNINAVVAVVAGFLIVAQTGIVQTINLFIPRVSLIIIVILMGLLIISMLAGGTFSGIKGSALGIATAIVIVVVILALTTPPTGYGGSWLTPTDIQILLSLGIPLLVLFGVIWLVTKGPETEANRTNRYTFDRFGREMGGRGEEEATPRPPRPPAGGA